jgi:hypothetical protein
VTQGWAAWGRELRGQSGDAGLDGAGSGVAVSVGQRGVGRVARGQAGGTDTRVIGRSNRCV